jgi:hypothetical protein
VPPRSPFVISVHPLPAVTSRQGFEIFRFNYESEMPKAERWQERRTAKA